MDRRFTTFWYIDVPNTPDHIYDHIFIDGTYTAAGCLLIAATRIQRCLVHAQPVVSRYTTNRPRTQTGRTIYALTLQLIKVTTTEQATQWVINLHDFGQAYTSFLNKKTPLPKKRCTATRTWEYTHLRIRKAYNSLRHLTRQGFLFTYLEPSPQAIDNTWAATTNSLEGGINAQLKLLARMHRGRSGERQRKMLQWWLHGKAQLPDDPLIIARQCSFGLDQLAKVTDLVPEGLSVADDETGHLALYDKAIRVEYKHNIGIRKGPLR